jgi:ADP-heptose:LPS heptosyltransferase
MREIIDKNWNKDTPEIQEMRDICEQICYTSSWNYTDLSRIIKYIVKYDLDVYDTLIKLADDYYHAMYRVKPTRTGPQSAADMVLTQCKYEYNEEKYRTPEIQNMLDEIYEMKSFGYLPEYRQSFSELLGLFKKTFEKHLIWGIDII